MREKKKERRRRKEERKTEEKRKRKNLLKTTAIELLRKQLVVVHLRESASQHYDNIICRKHLRPSKVAKRPPKQSKYDQVFVLHSLQTTRVERNACTFSKKNWKQGINSAEK